MLRQEQHKCAELPQIHSRGSNLSMRIEKKILILSANPLMTERLQADAELAEVWPCITEMKEALPDAEEWKGKPNKLELLQR